MAPPPPWRNFFSHWLNVWDNLPWLPKDDAKFKTEMHKHYKTQCLQLHPDKNSHASERVKEETCILFKEMSRQWESLKPFFSNSYRRFSLITQPEDWDSDENERRRRERERGV